MYQGNMVKECVIGNGLATRPSIRQQLADRKVRLEDELERVNESLNALDANPELTNVLETLTKTINIY